VKNPLTLDFIGQGAESAPAGVSRQVLDFPAFWVPCAAAEKPAGLQEIRAGGIMLTQFTLADPAAATAAAARTGPRACDGKKTITTGLFKTMHRLFSSRSPQSRPGHVA
jgi:hypothetical protein